MPATKGRVAGDLMQHDLVTVSPNDTLRDTLAQMTMNHVTGLPVMDDKSCCVGLITASDILNYEQDHASDSPENGVANVFDAETQMWESVPLSAFALQEFGHVRVSEVMTSELIWVKRDVPIEDVARLMLNEGVHRILVMDDRARLYGMLSAIDIVRYVAGA